MPNLYPPEGRLLHTAENQAAGESLAALRQAMARQTVVEGRAVLCTPTHDLVVRLGAFTGTIPREEAALGIREGTAREISILSRVGKPTACVVTGVEEAPFRLTLSRRRAQERALEALLACPAGTVLPATITHLAPFGAFVDVGCGVVSMVGIENCSVARISHPARRFRLDQEIYVVLTGGDRALGRVYLSHKELLGTWAENAARFSPGMTVPGWVRGVKPYGTFVELAPNLTGLADQTQGLREDDRVSVYLKAILPDRMKVKLNILQVLPPQAGPDPLFYFITSGQLSRWVYSPPGRKGPRIETVFG